MEPTHGQAATSHQEAVELYLDLRSYPLADYLISVWVDGVLQCTRILRQQRSARPDRYVTAFGIFEKGFRFRGDDEGKDSSGQEGTIVIQLALKVSETTGHLGTYH